MTGSCCRWCCVVHTATVVNAAYINANKHFFFITAECNKSHVVNVNTETNSFPTHNRKTEPILQKLENGNTVLFIYLCSFPGHNCLYIKCSCNFFLPLSQWLQLFINFVILFDCKTIKHMFFFLLTFQCIYECFPWF